MPYLLYTKNFAHFDEEAISLAHLSLHGNYERSIDIDPRVAYLHLAYHLDDSRAGQYDAKRNQNLALFSNVLGLQSVVAELGAIYLAIENGAAHDNLCEFIHTHHASLSNALGAVEEIVSARYDAHQSRIKAIHSIHKKMQQSNLLSPYQILDILAVRIIVDDVRECYAGIEWAASMWKLVGIKDYIASPKPNGYQSLHILVQVSSWTVELQLRTKDMHLEAEYGRASHASYKETVPKIKLRTMSALKRLKADGVGMPTTSH
tara:strand:- start:2274 stop:3059 length:786 start_codon:yes stop_codon:yes gene_type:complete